jgi:hypothetical protein
MPRIRYITAIAWLIAAAVHVNAQEPGSPDGVPQATVARARPARMAPPKMLPGTHPGVFSVIQGNALTSTNGALGDAIIRLRDARIGRIVETQLTDRSGLFAFPTVDPGSYILEIMGDDGSSVLAASQVLNVGPGEAVSAVVKLPFRIPGFAGIMGNPGASLAAMTAQAASAGVLAAQASGAETCITLQP